MRLVAESFAWPFRAPASTWILGILCVLLLPVLFIPLLGYAVAATRSAELDPRGPPPPWRISARLLSAGAWTSLALALTAVPFLVLWSALSSIAGRNLYAQVVVFFLLLFFWGVVALVVFPHATASFAATAARHDLFDVRGAVRAVRRDLATWNVVVAAIVTGWAIGIACVGLLCVGVLPGVFYAILVSAHAAAALHGPTSQGPGPSAQ